MTQLLFTSDFSQQVIGPLQPGSRCKIHYDPARLLSAAGLFSEASFSYAAHLQPNGCAAVNKIPLTTDTEAAPAGLLAGYFDIPDKTEEVSLWFSLTDANGNVYYDSKMGANYHFSPQADTIRINEAAVYNNAGSNEATFTGSVLAVPDVDAVVIRYRNINKGNAKEEIETTLQCSPLPHNNLWQSPGIKVPYGSIIVFYIMYYVNNAWYKNDNNGDYFLFNPVYHTA